MTCFTHCLRSAASEIPSSGATLDTVRSQIMSESCCRLTNRLSIFRHRLSMPACTGHEGNSPSQNLTHVVGLSLEVGGDAKPVHVEGKTLAKIVRFESEIGLKIIFELPVAIA